LLNEYDFATLGATGASEFEAASRRERDLEDVVVLEMKYGDKYKSVAAIVKRTEEFIQREVPWLTLNDRTKLVKDAKGQLDGRDSEWKMGACMSVTVDTERVTVNVSCTPK